MLDAWHFSLSYSLALSRSTSRSVIEVMGFNRQTLGSTLLRVLMIIHLETG